MSDTSILQRVFSWPVEKIYKLFRSLGTYYRLLTHVRVIHGKRGVVQLKDTPLLVCFDYRKDRDSDHLVRALIKIREHELSLIRFFHKNIKKGGNVVEVGTHFGTHAVRMAWLVGEEGKYIGIDGHPLMVQCTRTSLFLNGFEDRVELHEGAAFSESGKELDFYLRQVDTGGSGLYNLNEGEVKKIKVRTVVVDEVVGSRKIDLVKIDAEGAEPEILKGCKEMIKRNPGIILALEFGRYFYKDEGVGLLKYIREELGLNVYLINEEGEMELVSDEALINMCTYDEVTRKGTVVEIALKQ